MMVFKEVDAAVFTRRLESYMRMVYEAYASCAVFVSYEKSVRRLKISTIDQTGINWQVIVYYNNHEMDEIPYRQISLEECIDFINRIIADLKEGKIGRYQVNILWTWFYGSVQ